MVNYHLNITNWEVKMATAISGATIVNESSSEIVYRHVCDDCGHEERGTTSREPISSGQRLETSYRCDNCGQRQDLVIKGD
jgi:hypothetical protein